MITVDDLRALLDKQESALKDGKSIKIDFKQNKSKCSFYSFFNDYEELEAHFEAKLYSFSMRIFLEYLDNVPSVLGVIVTWSNVDSACDNAPVSLDK